MKSGSNGTSCRPSLRSRTHVRTDAAPLPQVLDQVVERLAGVEDVVDQQHVPAAEVGQHLVLDCKLAGRGRPAAVARRLDEGDLERQVEPADQVGEEHEAAGQHADDGERLAA